MKRFLKGLVRLGTAPTLWLLSRTAPDNFGLLTVSLKLFCWAMLTHWLVQGVERAMQIWQLCFAETWAITSLALEPREGVTASLFVLKSYTNTLLWFLWDGRLRSDRVDGVQES